MTATLNLWRRASARFAAAHADAVDLGQEVLKEAEYFATNTERMRYPEFREKGLFVGSGVVEAGCKSVIGSRLKRSGMFWTVRGANAIIALRCCRINGRFEDYWELDRIALDCLINQFFPLSSLTPLYLPEAGADVGSGLTLPRKQVILR